jgi:hypothetical protein
MIQEASELRDLLRGGPLQSRDVIAIDLARCRERVLAVPVDQQDLLNEWSAVRALAGQTGRWPVAAGVWSGARVHVPTAEDFGLEPKDDLRLPGTICAAARELRGREALDELWEARHALEERWKSQPYTWLTGDRVAWQLQATQQRCGSAPTADEVLASLRSEARERHRWSGPIDAPSEYELEFDLFRWEEEHRPTTRPECPDADDWFHDAPGAHLLLLPTAQGPESLAYMSSWFVYGGVAGATYDRMVAVLTWWQERYGAELVANWGSMLQFAVRRPPASLDEAWDLAVDIDLVGPSSGFPHVRDYARFLWRRPTWFIHNHP